MTQGGKRKGAGAKPKEDKKQQVSLYVPKSRIDKLGLDTVKELSYSAIEKAFKKLDK